ncbi:hypothetical protein H9P43_005270 [Blastocladiella emersonii ATCC 22665]|nr:hypothetical protein H9P43_005270 [Blastocladiella emersonii ATCC 22665]
MGRTSTLVRSAIRSGLKSLARNVNAGLAALAGPHGQMVYTQQTATTAFKRDFVAKSAEPIPATATSEVTVSASPPPAIVSAVKPAKSVVAVDSGILAASSAASIEQLAHNKTVGTATSTATKNAPACAAPAIAITKDLVSALELRDSDHIIKTENQNHVKAVNIPENSERASGKTDDSQDESVVKSSPAIIIDATRLPNANEITFANFRTDAFTTSSEATALLRVAAEVNASASVATVAIKEEFKSSGIIGTDATDKLAVPHQRQSEFAQTEGRVESAPVLAPSTGISVDAEYTKLLSMSLRAAALFHKLAASDDSIIEVGSPAVVIMDKVMSDATNSTNECKASVLTPQQDQQVKEQVLVRDDASTPGPVAVAGASNLIEEINHPVEPASASAEGETEPVVLTSQQHTGSEQLKPTLDSGSVESAPAIAVAIGVVDTHDTSLAKQGQSAVPVSETTRTNAKIEGPGVTAEAKSPTQAEESQVAVGTMAPPSLQERQPAPETSTPSCADGDANLQQAPITAHDAASQRKSVSSAAAASVTAAASPSEAPPASGSAAAPGTEAAPAAPSQVKRSGGGYPPMKLIPIQPYVEPVVLKPSPGFMPRKPGRKVPDIYNPRVHGIGMFRKPYVPSTIESKRYYPKFDYTQGPQWIASLGDRYYAWRYPNRMPPADPDVSSSAASMRTSGGSAPEASPVADHAPLVEAAPAPGPAPARASAAWTPRVPSLIVKMLEGAESVPHAFFGLVMHGDDTADWTDEGRHGPTSAEVARDFQHGALGVTRAFIDGESDPYLKLVEDIETVVPHSLFDALGVHLMTRPAPLLPKASVLALLHVVDQHPAAMAHYTRAMDPSLTRVRPFCDMAPFDKYSWRAFERLDRAVLRACAAGQGVFDSHEQATDAMACLWYVGRLVNKALPNWPADHGDAQRVAMVVAQHLMWVDPNGMIAAWSDPASYERAAMCLANYLVAMVPRRPLGRPKDGAK